MTIQLKIGKVNDVPGVAAEGSAIAKFWLTLSFDSGSDKSSISSRLLAIEQQINSTKLINNFSSTAAEDEASSAKVFSGRISLTGENNTPIGSIKFKKSEVTHLSIPSSSSDNGMVFPTLALDDIEYEYGRGAGQQVPNAERPGLYDVVAPFESVKLENIPGVDGTELDCKVNASLEFIGGSARGIGNGDKLGEASFVLVRETHNDWVLPLWKLARQSLLPRGEWKMTGDACVKATIQMRGRSAIAEAFLVDQYTLSVEQTGEHTFKSTESLSMRLAKLSFNDLTFKVASLFGSEQQV